MAPSAKKLKTEGLASHEKNLKIVIGSGKSKTVLWYHSAVMATHSKFIDNALASSMKEAQTYEICFPDITMEIWNRMMKFLNVVEARTMTADDAMELAKWYDMYDFSEGFGLCDGVLLGIFDDLVEKEKTDQEFDIGMVVKIAVVALDCNLTKTHAKSSRFALNMMTDGSKIGKSYHLGKLTESHVRDLVPVIEAFVEEDETLLHKLLPFAGANTLSLDDFKHKMFPRLFVTEWNAAVSGHMMRMELCPRFRLAGSNLPQVNGTFKYCSHRLTYESNRLMSIGGQDYSLLVHKKQSGIWAIRGKGQTNNKYTTLWEAPYFCNYTLPPTEGWKPVHDLARPNHSLTITHMAKGVGVDSDSDDENQQEDL